MASELYREEIIDHYKNPRNVGTLDPVDKRGRLEKAQATFIA